MKLSQEAFRVSEVSLGGQKYSIYWLGQAWGLPRPFKETLLATTPIKGAVEAAM